MTLTLGCHNLHDNTGTPTPFADVILFTEAIPANVRKTLGDQYDVHVCKFQRDLVIAFRRGIWEHHGENYRLAHIGIPLVTPHRGTFVVRGRLHGKRTKVLVEHRINAAFPPFRRGERLYRPTMWNRHTKMTLRMIARARRNGWALLAGGDLNTVKGVKGYRGVLYEVGEQAGHGYDRLASTRPIAELEVLSRMGSDHPRLRGALS